MRQLFHTATLAAIVAIFISGCTSIEKVPSDARQLQFIHEVELTEEEIFNGAREWLALSFVDSKEVVEVADKSTGMILGKGRTNIMNLGIAEVPVRFTITIEVKEGRYRTTYDNFVGYWGEYHNRPRPVDQRHHIEQLHESLTALDQDLNNYLSEEAGKSDDW